MDDYIDRQAALEAIQAERDYMKARKEYGAEHILTHCGYRIIADMPSADVEPVRHGRWKYRKADGGCHTDAPTAAQEWMVNKMIHKVKIWEDYANSILCGDKTFEVRYNDRNYQKGDFIEFDGVSRDGLPMPHNIDGMMFEITNVHSGLGMAEGYVVLAIKRVDDEQDG